MENNGEARIQVNKRELSVGIFLVLTGFFLPLCLTVHRFGVRERLDAALTRGDAVLLLEAALLLVLLNALRAMPNYIGAFFIGESIAFSGTATVRRAFSALATVAVLLLTYRAIGWVHGIHYDFGTPAVLVCALVLLLARMGYRYISLGKKSVLIVLFLTAFQFLDIMPLIDRFPAGRGETSWNLKQAAAILDAEALLNAGGLVGMLVFALFGVVIWFQLRDENTLRALRELTEQNQEMRMQSYLTEMENRKNREVQYLVHDLKSPLTAIETMTGILRMEREQDGAAHFPKDGEYLDRIEGAVERMSRMISEILYEEKGSPVTTGALVHIVLAQASVTDYARFLRVENEAPEALVTVNRVLFPRAIVNLLQNSAQAMEGQESPCITLRVRLCERAGADCVAFTVSDNGRGIAPEQQERVWSCGVSGRASSGLGLAFVKKTVQEMGGEIALTSRSGEGTSITVFLPRGGEPG